MSNKVKLRFKPWGEKNNPGRGVADVAWTGTKAVVFAAVAGLALGLGLGAYNSASA